ncbi:MAG TPA: alpha/beta hydrolase, partial [Albitalea sp.]|nr:alpha/beta hydrolase [Albitalea sp.]
MNTTLTTADGLSLHLHHWPVAGMARGTVLLVHGLGEHVGRYAQVAKQLNDSSWNVIGHDHRG